MRTIKLTDTEAETVAISLKVIAEDLMLNGQSSLATYYRELAKKFEPKGFRRLF